MFFTTDYTDWNTIYCLFQSVSVLIWVICGEIKITWIRTIRTIRIIRLIRSETKNIATAIKKIRAIPVPINCDSNQSVQIRVICGKTKTTWIRTILTIRLIRLIRSETKTIATAIKNPC